MREIIAWFTYHYTGYQLYWLLVQKCSEVWPGLSQLYWQSHLLNDRAGRGEERQPRAQRR
jgi:hypothetical protein